MIRAKPRLAVRGLLVVADKLLLVNAYKGREGALYCAQAVGLRQANPCPKTYSASFTKKRG